MVDRWKKTLPEMKKSLEAGNDLSIVNMLAKKHLVYGNNPFDKNHTFCHVKSVSGEPWA